MYIRIYLNQSPVFVQRGRARVTSPRALPRANGSGDKSRFLSELITVSGSARASCIHCVPSVARGSGAGSASRNPSSRAVRSSLVQFLPFMCMYTSVYVCMCVWVYPQEAALVLSPTGAPDTDLQRVRRPLLLFVSLKLASGVD